MSSLPTSDAPSTTQASNERARWPRQLARWLDDYGLDALIGLIPVGGDTLTGLASLSILIHGLREGVPTVILFRMLLHILTDTVVGFVPVLGDVFDFVYRANRKNLDLIDEFADGAREPTFGDYAIVATAGAVLVLAILVPIFFLGAIGTAITQWLQ